MPVTRLSRPLHGPESQVRTAPTPGGGGRPEGAKPPLRVSYAVQKPAGTPYQWVAAGGGRIEAEDENAVPRLGIVKKSPSPTETL